jgi:hypothetical protein
MSVEKAVLLYEVLFDAVLSKWLFVSGSRDGGKPTLAMKRL